MNNNNINNIMNQMNENSINNLEMNDENKQTMIMDKNAKRLKEIINPYEKRIKELEKINMENNFKITVLKDKINQLNTQIKQMKEGPNINNMNNNMNNINNMNDLNNMNNMDNMMNNMNNMMNINDIYIIEIYFEYGLNVQKVKCLNDELVLSIIHRYCEKNNLNENSLSFSFHGMIIPNELKASDIGIVNLSTIEVRDNINPMLNNNSFDNKSFDNNSFDNNEFNFMNNMNNMNNMMNINNMMNMNNMNNMMNMNNMNNFNMNSLNMNSLNMNSLNMNSLNMNSLNMNSFNSDNLNHSNENCNNNESFDSNNNDEKKINLIFNYKGKKDVVFLGENSFVGDGLRAFLEKKKISEDDYKYFTFVYDDKNIYLDDKRKLKDVFLGLNAQINVFGKLF